MSSVPTMTETTPPSKPVAAPTTIAAAAAKPQLEEKKKKAAAHDRIIYPFWFGGSASSMAACVTHPLDLGTFFLMPLPATAISDIFSRYVPYMHKYGMIKQPASQSVSQSAGK